MEWKHPEAAVLGAAAAAAGLATAAMRQQPTLHMRCIPTHTGGRQSGQASQIAAPRATHIASSCCCCCCACVFACHAVIMPVPADCHILTYVHQPYIANDSTNTPSCTLTQCKMAPHPTFPSVMHTFSSVTATHPACQLLQNVGAHRHCAKTHPRHLITCVTATQSLVTNTCSHQGMDKDGSSQGRCCSEGLACRRLLGWG
jgi:hypothetical protein